MAEPGEERRMRLEDLLDANQIAVRVAYQLIDNRLFHARAPNLRQNN